MSKTDLQVSKYSIKEKLELPSIIEIRSEDYWKSVENYDPFAKTGFDPKQAQDIISKVAKGEQGN